MKCPLKEDNFGRMPDCQSDCAWRMTYIPTPSGLDMPVMSSCAIAVLAQGADNAYGIMFEREVDDE